jgi:hypothetical protein
MALLSRRERPLKAAGKSAHMKEPTQRIPLGNGARSSNPDPARPPSVHQGQHTGEHSKFWLTHQSWPQW